MSIKDDIQALEKALEAQPLTHPGVAVVEKEHLRRLLDALKAEEERSAYLAAIGLALSNTMEAKLAKAIELLKEADGRSVDLCVDERISAYLKEISE